MSEVDRAIEELFDLARPYEGPSRKPKNLDTSIAKIAAVNGSSAAAVSLVGAYRFESELLLAWLMPSCPHFAPGEPNALSYTHTLDPRTAAQLAVPRAGESFPELVPGIGTPFASTADGNVIWANSKDEAWLYPAHPDLDDKELALQNLDEALRTTAARLKDGTLRHEGGTWRYGTLKLAFEEFIWVPG